MVFTQFPQQPYEDYNLHFTDEETIPVHRVYYGSAKIIKENSIYQHRKIFKMHTKIFILDSKVKNQVAKQNVYYNIIFPQKRNKKVRDTPGPGTITHVRSITRLETNG